MSRHSHFSRSAEPRKRPAQTRSRELVQRILDEAARLFDERGYRGTTTNHVAEAAGISIGSLYQYFPNKDALLVGLAERHLDEVVPRLTALAARLRRDAPPAEQLCRTIVAEVAALNRSDRLHQLLWSAPRTEALQERLAALDAALVDEVEWHLQRLGHPVATSRPRAHVLVTTIDAGIHSRPTDVDHDAYVDELVRLATAYVSTPA